MGEKCLLLIGLHQLIALVSDIACNVFNGKMTISSGGRNDLLFIWDKCCHLMLWLPRISVIIGSLNINQLSSSYLGCDNEKQGNPVTPKSVKTLAFVLLGTVTGHARRQCFCNCSLVGTEDCLSKHILGPTQTSIPVSQSDLASYTSPISSFLLAPAIQPTFSQHLANIWCDIASWF